MNKTVLIRIFFIIGVFGLLAGTVMVVWPCRSTSEKFFEILVQDDISSLDGIRVKFRIIRKPCQCGTCHITGEND